MYGTAAAHLEEFQYEFHHWTTVRFTESFIILNGTCQKKSVFFDTLTSHLSEKLLTTSSIEVFVSYSNAVSSTYLKMKKANNFAWRSEE